MIIRKLSLIEGAKQARGLTVIIDVFRAISVENYLFEWGLEKVIAVGDLDRARELKSLHPDYILIGERKGIKCEGFDFGNSPSQIKGADLRGKTAVHTTSAGTQGIANAVCADEILVASLVNASATAAYIRDKAPDEVSLVAMGNLGIRDAKEDLLCADYIEALLTGRTIDMENAVSALKTDGGEHFFDPAKASVFPAEDFRMSTLWDKFPYVLGAAAESAPGISRPERNGEAVIRVIAEYPNVTKEW